MDKKDTEFTAKLLATFKIEAEEHIQALSKEIVAFEQSKDPEEKKKLLESIFREAHSLKGAARSVNQLTIQTVCQALENVLAALKQERLQPSKEIINGMYATLDLIQKILSGDHAHVDKDTVNALIHTLDQFLEGQPKQQAIPETKKIIEIKEEVPLPPTQPIREPERTIRVSERKLDLLFQQIEEMLSIKLNAYHHHEFLRQIYTELNAWEKKWKNSQPGMKSFLEIIEQQKTAENGKQKPLQALFTFYKWQESFFSSLDETLKLLLKRFSQDLHFAGSAVDSIMEDTRKLLMQPFSTLFEMMPRMARDLAESTGKEVHLEFVGEQVEVDRRILEEMKDPLIHLIRNCIDHGIETPLERENAHKPRQGNIKISAAQTGGNTVELVITDDGKGIDISRVKEAAIKIGALSPDEGNAMSDSQAIYLIFRSGVSTSKTVSDLSGRGVGMGVVQEKVDRLGGSIHVDTATGVGSTFRIILPTTLATFRGIFVKAGGQDFILPTLHIQRVLQIQQKEIQSFEGHLGIILEGQSIPILSLTDLLQLSSSLTNSDKQKPAVALLVAQKDLSAALIVEEVINEQEVLLKPINPHLNPSPHVLAATVAQSGEVIPVLNSFELLKSALSTHFQPRLVEAKIEKQPAKMHVLIAEDSTTTRMLLRNIIQSLGYDVTTAKDGQEAWAIFNSTPIDLVISDVEMPNMDGLTLAKNIRSAAHNESVPIVLCTSLASEEDRKRGFNAGANAYLDKADFTETKLVNVISRVLKK